MHYCINGNTPEETGVLGFTELITELEAIARLPIGERNFQLAELGQRKRQSIARLCHLSAVIALYGVGGVV